MAGKNNKRSKGAGGTSSGATAAATLPSPVNPQAVKPAADAANPPAIKRVTKEEGRHLFGVGKDSAFQAVAALKGTRPFMGGTFVPDKLMTVARRRRLGIKSFSDRAESPMMYATRVDGGWAIGKRSGR